MVRIERDYTHSKLQENLGVARQGDDRVVPDVDLFTVAHAVDRLHFPLTRTKGGEVTLPGTDESVIDCIFPKLSSYLSFEKEGEWLVFDNRKEERGWEWDGSVVLRSRSVGKRRMPAGLWAGPYCRSGPLLVFCVTIFGRLFSLVVVRVPLSMRPL